MLTPEGKACRQLIREALKKYDLPDSDAVIRLLEMIAAHESGGFTYSRQLGGPALSLFQIEPATYRDLCSYADRKRLAICREFPRNPMRLVFDPAFAAGMARVFFLRFPEPLPDKGNITSLAEYAKYRWNTEQGKATPQQYETAWRRYYEIDT